MTTPPTASLPVRPDALRMQQMAERGIAVDPVWMQDGRSWATYQVGRAEVFRVCADYREAVDAMLDAMGAPREVPPKLVAGAEDFTLREQYLMAAAFSAGRDHPCYRDADPDAPFRDRPDREVFERWLSEGISDSGHTVEMAINQEAPPAD